MFMTLSYVPIRSHCISALRTQITVSKINNYDSISRLEAKMRAEGKIISRDYMTPEDKEWLEMDIEDSIRLADGEYEIPFYESDEWIRQFGRKP
jgi:hypothetical protein